jgi:hypothetical protein
MKVWWEPKSSPFMRLTWAISIPCVECRSFHPQGLLADYCTRSFHMSVGHLPRPVWTSTILMVWLYCWFIHRVSFTCISYTADFERCHRLYHVNVHAQLVGSTLLAIGIFSPLSLERLIWTIILLEIIFRLRALG